HVLGAASAAAPEPAAQGRPWGLWRRQVAAVLRLETRRILFGKRTIPIYVLAALPVVLFLFRALFAHLSIDEQKLATSITIFGAIYQPLILRMCVFFGCVALFTSLIRGEFLDRSLHYYFLAPIRRDVLLVGKYIAGVLCAAAIFCASAAAAV